MKLFFMIKLKKCLNKIECERKYTNFCSSQVILVFFVVMFLSTFKHGIIILFVPFLLVIKVQYSASNITKHEKNETLALVYFA